MATNIVQLFEEYQDYIEARQDQEHLPTFSEWRWECEEEAKEAAVTNWEIDHAERSNSPLPRRR